MIDPVTLADKLLARVRFAPAPYQNVLAAAWPAFYRRFGQPARPGDKPRDWWAGPALFQLLFAQEHNLVFRRLASAHPWEAPARLRGEAGKVAAALIHKIHRQWQTSQLSARGPHRVWGRLRRYPWGRGPARGADHGGVASLLPCIGPSRPDRFEIFSAITGTRLGPAGGFGFLALCDPQAGEFIEQRGADNLWYSLGTSCAGAFQLANHCAAARRLPAIGAEGFVNLAADSIRRQRLAQPATYNALRRLLGLAPIRRFSELDPTWRAQLQDCYSRVDDIDAWIGLLAEPRAAKSGLGETACRCLETFDRVARNDRALSGLGARWVRDNSLKTLLLRHYPLLQDGLYRIENPFAPWRSVQLIEPRASALGR